MNLRPINMKTNVSPLLHAIKTNTPLDLVSERFFFIIPLNYEQIQWLNTVIYKDNLFWINYWSLTHTFLGFIYGLFQRIWPEYFTIKNYLILHTLFEIWELWASGYLTGERKLVLQEILDIIMDTLFGFIGVILASLL